MKYEELNPKIQQKVKEKIVKWYFDDELWYKDILINFVQDMNNKYDFDLEEKNVEFNISYSQSNYAMIQIDSSLKQSIMTPYMKEIANNVKDIEDKKLIEKELTNIDCIKWLRISSKIYNRPRQEEFDYYDFDEVSHILSILLDNGDISEQSHDEAMDMIDEVGDKMSHELYEKISEDVEKFYRSLRNEIEYFWEEENVVKYINDCEYEFDENGNIL